MTWAPCLDCGEVVPGTRCADCSVDRGQRPTTGRGSSTARGYDARWQRLSVRARRLQPFCTDCGTREDLTADHLVWPARTLAEVDVVCRPCNSKRGPTTRAEGARTRPLRPAEADFGSQTAMPSRQTVYGAPSGPPGAA